MLGGGPFGDPRQQGWASGLALSLGAGEKAGPTSPADAAAGSSGDGRGPAAEREAAEEANRLASLGCLGDWVTSGLAGNLSEVRAAPLLFPKKTKPSFLFPALDAAPLPPSALTACAQYVIVPSAANRGCGPEVREQFNILAIYLYI